MFHWDVTDFVYSYMDVLDGFRTFVHIKTINCILHAVHFSVHFLIQWTFPCIFPDSARFRAKSRFCMTPSRVYYKLRVTCVSIAQHVQCIWQYGVISFCPRAFDDFISLNQKVMHVLWLLWETSGYHWIILDILDILDHLNIGSFEYCTLLFLVHIVQ